MLGPTVTGWRCDTCGTEVPIATVWPWRCPAAGESRHHVLRIVRRPGPLQHVNHPNPFVAYDGELAWASFADAHGMDVAARRALVLELDAAVAGFFLVSVLVIVFESVRTWIGVVRGRMPLGSTEVARQSVSLFPAD